MNLLNRLAELRILFIGNATMEYLQLFVCLFVSFFSSFFVG